MQSRILALIPAMIGLFFNSLASALDLGEITLKSSLNKPLEAEIRLLGVQNLSKSEITIQLASHKDFQSAGIEQVPFLSDIKFEVDLSNRSKPLVHLRSSNPVLELYLSFILEARSPSGRLLREYTLLMDLPVFDSNSTTAPIAVPKTVRSKVQATESERSNSSSIVASAISASVPRVGAGYRVVEGDTLWGITLQANLDRTATVHQIMLATQRANPEVFINGNINLLRKGKVLRLPDKMEIQRITPQQAMLEVARQNQQWSTWKTAISAVFKDDSEEFQSTRLVPSKPEGRLTLSFVDNTSAASVVESTGVNGAGMSLKNELAVFEEELDRTKKETREFSRRIEQLEAQIETMEKLIEVQNSKLRALQLEATREGGESKVAAETSKAAKTNLQKLDVVGDNTSAEQSESSVTSVFIEDSLLANSLVTAIIFLTVASFIAGFIDSIAGGAGLVLVPSFIVAGMPPQLALGQEKLVSTIGTISAISNFVKQKKVIWRLVPAGVVLGLLGAYVGARAILFIDEKLVAKIIVLMLPIGLLFTLFKSNLMSKKTDTERSYDATKSYLLIIGLVSFTIGFYDGFFGPGTGSLFIIALYLFIKIDLVKASATSKIFNFASNIGAFVAFSLAGKMLFKLGIPMVLGSLAGNYIGSKLTIKKGERIVKTVLVLTISIMLVTLSLKFIFE